jgi:hypothetical protein
MITVKFPALQKALDKDLKDLPENDPRRGIIVLNNNAIVIRNQFCFVCDLYEYFTVEEGIEDQLDLEELERILFFMDGKTFGIDFWKELTNGANMKMVEGNLFVDTPKYSKALHYKDIDIRLLEPLSALKKITYQEPAPIDCVAIPFGVLQQIYSCLAPSFKLDFIILEFNAQERPVKFTFKNRKHFYGYIMPHYDAAVEGFKFDNLETFFHSISGYHDQLVEEYNKTQVPPLPPPSQDIANGIVEDANEEDNEPKFDM